VSRAGRFYLGVMLGGAAGSVARYGIAVLALRVAGPSFPWGTLLANVVGSLGIGLYATLTGPDGRRLVSPAVRQAVMVGVLGGFTTFSVFSLEVVMLAVEGRAVAAGSYWVLSLVLWLPAVWAGHGLAMRWNRLDGRARKGRME
jgi:fluoride exporter